MDEREQRQAVVAEALTWLRTPYHHQGSVKGAGVDCGMFLIEVFHACGHIPHIDPRPYPHDWHLHQAEEQYLGWVRQHAKPVTNREPMAGDIILYKFGKCISHGAIVVDYPQVIHSYLGQGVVLANTLQNPLGKRIAEVYSYWG